MGFKYQEDKVSARPNRVAWTLFDNVGDRELYHDDKKY